MQAIINDALAITIACLVIAALASAFIVFSPAKRRHRRRKRHSRRSKIDLFKADAAAPAAKPDA